MSSKRVGIFYRLGDILDAFIGMGCDLNTAEAQIEDEDGSIFNCRYLLNPATKQFAVIQDIGNDEYISADEVAQWERRTGITIPKPPPLGIP
jgi:hypothetical protein